MSFNFGKVAGYLLKVNKQFDEKPDVDNFGENQDDLINSKLSRANSKYVLPASHYIVQNCSLTITGEPEG